jgi:hypothetical protein
MIVAILIIVLFIHDLSSIKNGTQLHLANILITAILASAIIGGCLFSLSNTRIINWKSVLLISAILGIAFLWHYVLSIPKVVQYLGPVKYTVLFLFYLAFQIGGGLLWYKTLKPKKSA